MGHLPLEQLEAFVAAARLGKLSLAAESMHLTVSALSHRMRQLEQRLGQRLLARGPRGVELTVEGRQLYEAVSAPLDAIGQALRRASPRNERSITLSLIPSMATAWLVPRLPAFLAAHPDLGLSLQSSTHLVDFEREPVDLALRLGNGNWPGLHAEHLFDEWLAPVASPALLRRHARVPAAQRLQRLPLLGDPAGRWEDWFARHGGTPPARHLARFSDTESLHQAAAESVGVALARLTLVEPLLRAGRLVRLGRRRMPAGFSHYLVYPERSLAHPAFAAVRAWVLEQAAATAPG